MGYALLWIEGLAVALLLVATLLACAGRLERRWLRLGAFLVVTLGLALVFTALTVVAGWLQFSGMSDRWFVSTLLLTAAFVAGAVWLGFSGLRRGNGRPAAAAWPRGKLALALGVAAALHAMTYWNLDLAVRQQLAALKIEAGALALAAAPPRIADRDNAALLYEQAFEVMGRDAELRALLADEAWQESWNDKWTRWRESGKVAFDADDPRLRRVLEQHSGTLRLLRQAAARPGCYFDRDYGRPSLFMRLPELVPLRDGARLLALDAICRVSDGDGRRAIEDITALLGMAEHMRSDFLAVPMFVAMTVDRLGIEALEVCLATGRLRAEELPTEWLEGTATYRALLKRVLRGEEACRLATFAQVGEGQYAFGDLIDVLRGHGDGTVHHVRTAFPYRVYLLGDDLAAHTRLSAELDNTAGEPYWKAKDRMQEYDQQVRNRPGGVLTSTLMPPLGELAAGAARGDARREAVRLGLALYRYQAKHGRFPEKLDELVPEFLSAVPRDPFDGRPMRMKPSARGVTVYSVGVQPAESGGLFFDLERTAGEISFTVPEQGVAAE